MSGDRAVRAVAVVMLALSAAALAAEPADPTGDEAPWLTPGLVSTGVYRVWCSTVIDPPDALALAGRPPREIEEGETGTLVRTTTEVAVVDGGRRVPVRSTAEFCTVSLHTAGTYEVSVHEQTLHWAWLRHPEEIGLTRTTQGDRTSRRSWRVRVVDVAMRDHAGDNPCDDTDARVGEESDEAEALRRAVASALAARGARIGPEHVIVQRDGLLSFAVYLRASDRQPRHHIDCLVREAEEGNLELPLPGALHLILGGVQHAADQTRVTMRVAEVETSVVLDAGMGQSQGTGEAAMTEAAHDAAADIDFDLFGW